MGYKESQDEEFRRRLEIAEGVEMPYSFNVSHSTDELPELYESDDYESEQVSVAGRVMAIRNFGGLTFLDVYDRRGKIQISLEADELPEQYDEYIESLDIGDIVGVRGPLYTTRTGELTVNMDDCQMLSKSLRPMPEKYHGIQDPEKRYRQRYLDLIANDGAMEVAMKRIAFVESVRQFLRERDFVEVETPILQPIYGGANAEPFITHHNALDTDMYLRISNELYLKRLIIAGMERVFEFSRDFRNEGIDTSHNPEFTQLELYQAYADYMHMMDLAEEMIKTGADSIGVDTVEFKGDEISIMSDWKRISMLDAIKTYVGMDVEEMPDQQLYDIVEDMEGETPLTRGHAIAAIFEEQVEGKLTQPTMVFDYPVEVSPLARKHRDDPRFVERFEIFMGGFELGNSYSELNDPVEQRKRFEQQVREAEKGDEEAHPMDEDFLTAMEYAMPPTGGLGVGVDRLTAILTGSNNLRESILFPTLRPKNGA